MITEDYVSFETAKLLKEKGFDWTESPFYSEQDRDEWRRDASYGIPNPCYDDSIPFDSPIMYVTAPHVSIQMAMKWLRDVHNLYITITHRFSHNSDNDVYFGYYININAARDGEWLTHEEACEAAIKYCLENII